MINKDLLRKAGLFADLDAGQLESILRVAEIRRFAKNTVLLRQGERGDTLYLVLSGRVKAVLVAEDGREVTLAMLDPGEMVGEMAVFDSEETRSATVITVEASELLILSGDQFKQALQENPSIAIAVIRTLSRRLKETNNRVGSLIFLDTYSRVARYLLDLAKRQGRQLADGSVVVVRPTQQEIALYLGTSRETVSRALTDLEHQGLIRLLGRKIILYRLQR